MNNSVFHFDVPQNEPILDYAPGSPERPGSRPSWSGRPRRDRDPAHHRRRGGAHRADPRRGHALRARPRAGPLPPGRRGGGRAGDRGGARGAHAVGDPVLGRARLDHAQGGRTAVEEAPRSDQRRDHARPGQERLQAEIDAACEIIDFLRYNVYFASQIYADQPRSRARAAQPDGVPAARGVRLHRQPVQLHRHRLATSTCAVALMGNTTVWKPATHRAALELLPDEGSSWRRGCPPGVINFVPGQRPRGRRRRARHRRPGRDPLHRLERAPSTASGRRSAENLADATAPTRASSARPAARTSSSSTPRPTRRRWRPPWSAAPSSTRGRSARPPRRAYVPRSLWPEVRDGWWRHGRRAIKVGDVRDFAQLRQRGDRRGGLRHHHGLHRAGQGVATAPRSSSAATATSPPATSSSRPSSRPTTRTS